MRRRALLASLGILGLAGCTDSPATDPASPTSEPTPTATSPGTDVPPDGTPTGTPPDAGVPPGDSTCPAVEVDRVVCAPETDPESVPLALTADSRSGSLPATFEFTLANGTEATLHINFYDWGLWKRVSGEWFYIVPREIPEPLMRLPSGESHSWRLTAEHELPEEFNRWYGSWTDSGTVSGLGGGEYAFTTGGWFGDYDDGHFGFGVLLEFDAPELTLEPTDSVTDSSRDGDTVTVRGTGDDSDDARRAEFVLTHVDDAEEPRSLIPETAAQDYRLRNTLPFFEEGVERVRFVAENAVVPAFGVTEPYTVSYRGELFRVTADELETETETY